MNPSNPIPNPGRHLETELRRQAHAARVPLPETLRQQILHHAHSSPTAPLTPHRVTLPFRTWLAWTTVGATALVAALAFLPFNPQPPPTAHAPATFNRDWLASLVPAQVTTPVRDWPALAQQPLEQEWQSTVDDSRRLLASMVHSVLPTEVTPNWFTGSSEIRNQKSEIQQ